MRSKVAVSVIFILAGFFCGPRAESQELVKVKVYHQPVIARAPLMIAYEEGFFRQEGIDVEFVKVPDAGEALILLLQGSLDAIIAPPSAGLYNAVNEGKSVRIVAGGAGCYQKGNRFEAVVVNERIVEGSKGRLDIIRSLKHKKIGIQILGSLPHYYLETLLKRNNIAPSEVEFVIMSLSVTKGAIENGSLDAAFLTEPFIILLSTKMKVGTILFSEEFPDHASGFLMFGPNFLKKNPDLGVNFVRAYLKGCRQYDQGKTKRNIEILEKYIDLDEGLLKKMDWPGIVPESIYDVSEEFSGFMDWLVEKGYVQKRMAVGSVIDDYFIKKAKNGMTQ